jgi:hypothetical protein
MPAAAAKPTAATESDLDAAMPEVFAKLGLPAELMAELAPPAGNAERGARNAEQDENAEETETTEAKPEGDDENAERGARSAEQGEEENTEGEEGTETTEEKPEGETEEEEKPEAGAELKELQTQLDAEKTRVAELETELQARATRPVEIAATALHPVLMADSEQDIAKMDAQLGAFEAWALKNWDGTEAVEAKGDQPAMPAYSAEQVRARYAAIKEQRAKLIPAAKEALATRRTYEKDARAAYPELFDAKKPEAQMLRAVLAQAPGLKVIFPNIHMVFGDAIRGEKARQAEAAAKAKPAKAAKPAPKVPVRVAPGSGKPVGGTPAKKATGGVLNIDRFLEKGGDRDALVAELMAANF